MLLLCKSITALLFDRYKYYKLDKSMLNSSWPSIREQLLIDSLTKVLWYSKYYMGFSICLIFSKCNYLRFVNLDSYFDFIFDTFNKSKF